jgi:DNA repair exonuclease SbcCD ATPase subunit
MQLMQLRLSNFKSFINQSTFDFHTQPGLYYLKGENRAEPDLGANGAGKSSIWEALCWVFFSKTSRKLKAGDVGNWSVGKNTRVEVDFEQDEVYFTLIRTWNPNSLKIKPLGSDDSDAQDITQEELEDLIRINYDAFLFSVMSSQASPAFLDLGATEKSNLMSKVMDLDRWLSYADQASKKAADVARGIENQKFALSKLEGRVQELQVVSFVDHINVWDKETKKRLDDLDAEHEKLSKNRKAEFAVSEGLTDLMLTLKQEIDLLKVDRKSEEDTIQSIKLTTRSWLQKIADSQARLNLLNERKDFLLHTQDCPTCKQKIEKKFREQELDDVEVQITQEVKTGAELNECLFSDERENNKRCEALQAINEKIQEKQKKLSEVEANQRIAKRAMQDLDSQLDRIEQEAARLEKQENPFKRQQEEAIAALTEALSDQRNRKRALSKLLREKEVWDYWVRGFKDLRLFLISEAMTQLEIEVNSALMQLGLLDWKIEFSPDFENKSGNITRGFTAFIRSPHNQGLVPWESWSGGESGRLRLATAMGLSNLILTSLGATFNVEVWDEPTAGLAAGGIEDLLTTLAERAVQNDKVVWIVDHHSLQHGGFSGETLVIKDQHGSYIES